ncbi:MAG TPA: hypothetical protein VJK29_22950 [Terriglobales bacterium]|nr:hypothetical protein [Terriglobales bacterium]
MGVLGDLDKGALHQFEHQVFQDHAQPAGAHGVTAEMVRSREINWNLLEKAG